MSNVDFTLTAEVRNDMGKGASRRLRRQGLVPAIIYGAEQDPVNINIDHDSLFHHLEHEAFFSHILTIDVAGKKEKAVLKDLQRHPAKPILMHADFMRVSDKEKLKMSVPLHFINEEVSPGVKKGGLVTHNITEVEVQCLPNDLPEFLEVDLAGLDMEQVLHLTDIKLPKGVELLELLHGTDHNQPIAAIHKTRASKEADESAEGEGESA
ncbi:MAG: 50S ribosomal protein L25/general stress protein Ctc [Chromatiales bacterium]|nr:50S ribosomal protein L25/general stress protein Ctc [Gammaproteobacteria bacterium]MBW6475702.1 50S ribosomal protein L25/general stress protein Ctc [Chromatiales bacterium]